MTAAQIACAALGPLCPVRVVYRAAAAHVARLTGIWREIADVRNALASMGEAWDDEPDENGHST